MGLANGSYVTADACSTPDLFWALRGGGGGSFALVTEVSYLLWKDVKIQDVQFKYVNNLSSHCPWWLGSIDALLSSSSDHNFTACFEDPNFTWNRSRGVFVNKCAQRKFAHLCGSWGKMQLNLYTNLDARWGGHGGSGAMQFRGTREDADAMLLIELQEFFSFPGAVELGNALIGRSPIFDTGLDVIEYSSWADYWTRWGIVTAKGLLAEKTYKQSQVCPTASSSGECIAKWVKEVTGKDLDAPSLDGGQWADNYPHAGTDTPSACFKKEEGKTCLDHAEERKPEKQCALVLDLSHKKRPSVMSDWKVPASLLLSGFPAYSGGGKVTNVPADATAIGPQMRSPHAYLQLGAGSETTCQAAFDQFNTPDAIFIGGGFNHWGRFVPTGGPRAFDNFIWGTNVGRLAIIKATFDPKHRFNAPNTFGYLPDC